MSEVLGISMLILRPLALSFERLGISPSLLLAPLQVTLDSNPEVRVPAREVIDVFDRIAADTGIDNLGLVAARGLPLGALGFVDYCVGASTTMRQALDRAARYCMLIFDGLSFEVQVAGGVAHIVQRYVGIANRRHAVEFTTALVVDRCRTLVGPDMAFRAASFAHTAPRDTGEHAQLLGIEPTFGAPLDVLTIDAALLDHPLMTADPALSELLEEHGKRLVGSLTPRDPLLNRVRERISGDLPNGAPELATVALAIKMAPRTLQRKLHDRGTSLSEVVDELRRELATQLVARGEASLTIALRLGFRDATAFYRAFKRWTGTTPGAFRARQ